MKITLVVSVLNTSRIDLVNEIINEFSDEEFVEQIMLISMIGNIRSKCTNWSKVTLIDVAWCHLNPEMTVFHTLLDHQDLLSSSTHIAWVNEGVVLFPDDVSMNYSVSLKRHSSMLDFERDPRKTCYVPHGLGYCEFNGRTFSGKKEKVLEMMKTVCEGSDKDGYVEGGINRYVSWYLTMIDQGKEFPE